jgi:cytochrome c oxidase subunit 1
MRTKGMKMTRMPLTIWAFTFTAILGILSFPVLFGGSLLLVFDRSFGTSFYLNEIPADLAGGIERVGGSPILFQHLFWFLGHPEVYIILLPALGITSEVIATNARKPIFGYRAMIGSIMAIAILSFIVWMLLLCLSIRVFVNLISPSVVSICVFNLINKHIPDVMEDRLIIIQAFDPDEMIDVLEQIYLPEYYEMLEEDE